MLPPPPPPPWFKQRRPRVPPAFPAHANAPAMPFVLYQPVLLQQPPSAAATCALPPAEPDALPPRQVIALCHQSLQHIAAQLDAACPALKVVEGVAGVAKTEIEELVEATFGSADATREELVSWIRDDSTRQLVAALLLALRDALASERNGNLVRTLFEQLIQRIAAYFLPDDDWTGCNPHQYEERLRTSFYDAALTLEHEAYVKRFSWGCFGVRMIGNERSHDTARLSDDEIRDVCACVRSLGTALPKIARELYPETFYRLGAKRSDDAAVHPEPVAEVSRATWARIVQTPPPASSFVPPPLKLCDSLQFFESFPELDTMKKMQVFRIRRHVAKQPKARLCKASRSIAHDIPSCPCSHSVDEVVRFNPLFKLIACSTESHYGSAKDPVYERRDCPFLHVDLGLKTEWMGDIAKGKRAFCVNGAKCRNDKCLKSHSFAEMCWYNPCYKVRPCDRSCSEPSLICSFYHEGAGDRRSWELDDDYVGKACEILFTNRTHGPLIKKLKALGL